MKLKTKDRKLRIQDTVYVFRVPVETSLDPIDIIKAGRVMLIREGIKRSVDVYGKDMGLVAKSWNAHPVMETHYAIKDVREYITAAVERTRRQLEAEEKHPGNKLPKLLVTSHKGQIIKRMNDSYYYIETTAYCDNCKEFITGYQKLEINKNGKVQSESAFIPYDAIQKPNSTKWLHPECAAKEIPVDEPDVTLADVIKAEEKINLEPKVYAITTEDILEILEDPSINAEWRCGAAWMFIKKQQEKEPCRENDN